MSWVTASASKSMVAEGFRLLESWSGAAGCIAMLERTKFTTPWWASDPSLGVGLLNSARL